jgi:hypothetical protein
VPRRQTLLKTPVKQSRNDQIALLGQVPISSGRENALPLRDRFSKHSQGVNSFDTMVY